MTFIAAIFWGLLGRWKMYLIIAGLSLGAIGGAYVKGRLDCNAKWASAQKSARIARLTKEHRARDDISKRDGSRLSIAEKKMSEQDRHIEELQNYASALQDRTSECLTAGDVDRVRSLWRGR